VLKRSIETKQARCGEFTRRTWPASLHALYAPLRWSPSGSASGLAGRSLFHVPVHHSLF